jgi:hypothetical protein
LHWFWKFGCPATEYVCGGFAQRFVAGFLAKETLTGGIRELSIEL